MKVVISVIACVALLIGCVARQAGNTRNGEKEQVQKVSFSGGNGDSPEEAVVISGVQKQSDGLDAEYDYISKIHGAKNQMWVVRGQTILKEKTKMYDVIEIKLNSPDNDSRIYYFDVSSFPWKKE